MAKQRSNPDHIVIVLNRPKHPENIGAAARAMKNMGLHHLVVVSPENYNFEKVMCWPHIRHQMWLKRSISRKI